MPRRQFLRGFFRARLKAFADCLEFIKAEKIFDIACGPGHIPAEISSLIDYIGLNSDERYIQFANAGSGDPNAAVRGACSNPLQLTLWGITISSC